jgi:hypothetical protein
MLNSGGGDTGTSGGILFFTHNMNRSGKSLLKAELLKGGGLNPGDWVKLETNKYHASVGNRRWAGNKPFCVLRG